jgi:hypothetical protein
LIRPNQTMVGLETPNEKQRGLHPLSMIPTLDALVAFNRQHLLSSQSEATPPSQVQRQPLTQAAFPPNSQDDDESERAEGENIDPLDVFWF